MRLSFHVAQLALVSVGVFHQSTLKTDVGIDKNAGTLHLIKSHLVRHPVLLYQVGHDDSGTAADSCCAYHESVMAFANLILNDLVCLLEMLLDRVIRHVIYIYHTTLYPVFLIWKKILRYTVHAQHEPNLMLFQFHGVQ